MLSTHATKYIALFFGLLITGLLFGNMVVLVISLAPLGLLLVGLLTEPPRRLAVTTPPIDTSIWVGDTVEISRTVTVPEGFGIITLYQELPQHFILVEGNNLQYFRKTWKPSSFTFSFKIRCAKRGHYVLRPFRWETRHVLNLTQAYYSPELSTCGASEALKVSPPPPSLLSIWPR
jgi:uncharacterized protein (DUF58 family)